ncbi:hypothetical protein B0T26DRAFT_161440 [Lasiosphaeria miniovina]|uniref:Uncharacterized protein n=1 Tax=Lasiosphaeria miniovina TaxID=1954250 RepID=A0AA40B5R9_9PEZI|nr:uncharacterized protein B0T26DRAFT_161440 [Lasiosphaeria miniovina]KAK0728172.1 hypothetical protein B0T26DRAFT_161440 [Lasiosphaeria miniovina]
MPPKKRNRQGSFYRTAASATPFVLVLLVYSPRYLYLSFVLSWSVIPRRRKSFLPGLLVFSILGTGAIFGLLLWRPKESGLLDWLPTYLPNYRLQHDTTHTRGTCNKQIDIRWLVKRERRMSGTRNVKKMDGDCRKCGCLAQGCLPVCLSVLLASLTFSALLFLGYLLAI